MYRVALLIETSSETGRGLLRGIFRYARIQGPWSFYLLPGSKSDQTLPTTRTWHGTGIIARMLTPKIERLVIGSKLPFVVISPSYRQRQHDHPFSRYPAIVSDQMGIGRVAFEYLNNCGYKNFAYIGSIPYPDWTFERGDAFRHSVEAAGFRCAMYQRAPKNCENWGLEQQLVIRWLRKLRKPVGIIAATDARAREVIEACNTAKLRVPEDVGVVGVGNDELQCELMDPPLSSVALNTESAGYKAAAELHRLMRGQSGKRELITIEQIGVVSRQSTELAGATDNCVAEAMRFIRQEANRPLQVPEVAEHVGISRRSLEQRFQKAIGRTPLAEIHRARFEKVQIYLLDTRLSVTEVAKILGFSSSSYLARICRLNLGTTPESWRQKHSKHIYLPHRR